MAKTLSNRIENIIDILYPSFMNNILNDLNENELIKDKKNFERDFEFKEQKSPHLNIICANCFKANFTGIRFLCSECNNFNLCEKCEELREHNVIAHNPNHIFLRINKPINVDINKYDNLIQGNIQNLKIKNGKSYAKISIFNSGIESLKNCYLMPICYGYPYILGNKITVKKDVERGEMVDLVIELEIPDNPNKIKKQFASIWRMFTKEGIPFGKVISFFINQ